MPKYGVVDLFEQLNKSLFKGQTNLTSPDAQLINSVKPLIFDIAITFHRYL